MNTIAHSRRLFKTRLSYVHARSFTIGKQTLGYSKTRGQMSNRYSSNRSSGSIPRASANGTFGFNVRTLDKLGHTTRFLIVRKVKGTQRRATLKSSSILQR